MINKGIKIRFFSLLLSLAVTIPVLSQEIKEDKRDKNARKIEKKADRKFIEQEFDHAMELYESAFDKAVTSTYTAALHLKTARLYLTLLDYSASIPHYEKAMSLDEGLFSSTDICNYLDALRYVGEKNRATKIAREYAYKDAYKKDQRYLNILHALTYEDGFLPVGTPEYSVKKMDKVNTSYSEFWVGKMRDEYFYATSNSRFHDPNKKFYHRTKYYSLNEDSEYSLYNYNANTDRNKKELLYMIPIYLQNGPLTFSDDMSKMVATEVAYDKGEQIKVSSSGINAFETRLYFSEYNTKRNGWSSFKSAFPQKQGASYAHPFLFNNDRSVLFSSDMEGGFGGYDIYVAHWDEKLKSWGNPINLGAQINTEGDEITPSIYDDMLIFSSNGHVGFGGYDIYGIDYIDGVVVAGSLVHFDYPVNTVLNDFSMMKVDDDSGYLVSDRYRVSKDDVFYFERNTEFTRSNTIYGMTENKAISNGAITVIGTEGNYTSLRNESLPKFHALPESMLSIYFDFDKADLNSTALQDLKNWISTVDVKNIESLVIDGYADEMGSADYNSKLSQSRAQTVAEWLNQQGIGVPARVAGKGQITVEYDPQELDSIKGSSSIFIDSAAKSFPTWNSKIWMNRKARRVEIKAILK